jgi:hypothetical protein
MQMKNALTIVAAVAAAMFSQATFAQAASSPTRAEVKAETAQAKKDGKLAPAGDTMAKPQSTKSEKTKAQRQADAKALEKSGKAAPAGDTMDKPAAKTSDTTRAAVKEETKADAKAGKLTPAGDAPAPAKK